MLEKVRDTGFDTLVGVLDTNSITGYVFKARKLMIETKNFPKLFHPSPASVH